MGPAGKKILSLKRERAGHAMLLAHPPATWTQRELTEAALRGFIWGLTLYINHAARTGR